MIPIPENIESDGQLNWKVVSILFCLGFRHFVQGYAPFLINTNESLNPCSVFNGLQDRKRIMITPKDKNPQGTRSIFLIIPIYFFFIVESFIFHELIPLIAPFISRPFNLLFLLVWAVFLVIFRYVNKNFVDRVWDTAYCTQNYIGNVLQWRSNDVRAFMRKRIELYSGGSAEYPQRWIKATVLFD